MDGRGDMTHRSHRRELPFSKHLQNQTDGSPAGNLRLVMKNNNRKKTLDVTNVNK